MHLKPFRLEMAANKREVIREAHGSWLLPMIPYLSLSGQFWVLREPLFSTRAASVPSRTHAYPSVLQLPTKMARCNETAGILLPTQFFTFSFRIWIVLAGIYIPKSTVTYFMWCFRVLVLLLSFSVLYHDCNHGCVWCVEYTFLAYMCTVLLQHQNILNILAEESYLWRRIAYRLASLPGASWLPFRIILLDTKFLMASQVSSWACSKGSGDW